MNNNLNITRHTAFFRGKETTYTKIQHQGYGGPITHKIFKDGSNWIHQRTQNDNTTQTEHDDKKSLFSHLMNSDGDNLNPRHLERLHGLFQRLEESINNPMNNINPNQEYQDRAHWERVINITHKGKIHSIGPMNNDPDKAHFIAAKTFSGRILGHYSTISNHGNIIAESNMNTLLTNIMNEDLDAAKEQYNQLQQRIAGKEIHGMIVNESKKVAMVTVKANKKYINKEFNRGKSNDISKKDQMDMGKKLGFVKEDHDPIDVNARVLKGHRVAIVHGSGIDSGKMGIVTGDNSREFHITTDSGEKISMFKNRVAKLKNQ